MNVIREQDQTELTAEIRKEDGSRLNLDGYNVRIRLENSGYENVLDERVQISDADAGEITYRFREQDLPAGGRYQMEFLIRGLDGETATVPTNDSIPLKVVRRQNV